MSRVQVRWGYGVGNGMGGGEGRGTLALALSSHCIFPDSLAGYMDDLSSKYRYRSTTHTERRN